MYRISVIVPIYNGAQYLRETLKALQEASKDKVQIILIDDGSTDQSNSVCKEYCEINDNILLHRKENGGIASARNKGLELATGQYVCFCDQDDIVEPDFFDVMLNSIEKNNADVAICGTNRYINGDKIVCEKFRDETWTGSEIMEHLIYPVLFYGTDLGRPPAERWAGTIWKCIISRELIAQNQLHFRRHVNYEDDLLFYIDVLCHADRASSVNYVGYNWRVNISSETYNWKYIDDFCDKYNNFIEDMLHMVASVCNDTTIINNFKNYQLCNMYEKLIINEGSCYNNKHFRLKISFIKDSILQTDFESAMQFRQHINLTSLHKKVTLTLIKYRMWTLAYLWSIGYKRMREKAIRNRRWFQLEKIIKEKS